MKKVVRRKPAEDRLDAVLNIRVTLDDLRRLDALCEAVAIGTRHALARAALRLGLDALERNPGILVKRRPNAGRH